MFLLLVKLVLIIIAFSPSSALAKSSNSEPSIQESTRDEDLNSLQWAAGGILSIYPGFGLGHAIQGRYLEDRGWTFTVLPFVGFLGGFALGALFADPSDPILPAFLGVYAVAAIRIWEISDAWIAPGYRLSAIDVKFFHGGNDFSLGLAYNF